MKNFKQTMLAGVLALCSFSAQAATNSKWYFDASGDATWLRHSELGGGGNVALGYRFMPGSFGAMRLEGEVGYHGAGGDDGYSSTHYFTYMGNAYYDFKKAVYNSKSGWNVAPYIGGGLGVATVHFGNSSFSNTFRNGDDFFAYQGMAGLNFTASSMPNTDWRIGYRYQATDTHNINSHNAEVGVRFYF